MRYDVKKVLFIGFSEDKDLFFKRAQEAGLVQFIPQKKGGRSREAAPEVEVFAQAIKILRGLPPVEQEEEKDSPLADELAKKVISIKASIDRLNEEERQVRMEMARVHFFGSFSLDEIHQIETAAKRKIQFFAGKQGISGNPKLPDTLIYLGSDLGLDYFVSIAKKTTSYEKLIEMKIDRPYQELAARRGQILKETHLLEAELNGFAKYNLLFHHALIHRLNHENLKSAQSEIQTPIEGLLFSASGWVPVHKEKELKALLSNLNVHEEEIAIEESDQVPTYLENQGFASLGEDIVHIYDTPSITDKDPSLWVLVFFTLFFSMIIGDAGYGLLFLALIVYLRYKTKKPTKTGKKLMTLAALLSCGIIVWGALTTSFFGISFSQDAAIRKVSLLNWAVKKKTAYHMNKKDAVYQEWISQFPKLKDAKTPDEFIQGASKPDLSGKVQYELQSKFADNILLELALFIGIIHIILSMVRYLDRNLINLGWIAVLIGAYLYVPLYLDATSYSHFLFGLDKQKAAEQGLYLIYGGTAFAVLLAIFKNKWLGILEIMTSVQLLSDVLSYLRLYALGLAGSIFSSTVNELAGMVLIIVGLPILFAGHAINIVLGLMGGVIHGLRLNFLEWYHYSFEGGGRKFKPLKKIEIE